MSLSDDPDDLRRMYPHLYLPVRCENGCGAVFSLLDGYNSYRRGADGKYLVICECCAAEEGHVDEEHETPDTAPACRRPPKRRIK